MSIYSYIEHVSVVKVFTIKDLEEFNGWDEDDDGPAPALNLLPLHLVVRECVAYTYHNAVPFALYPFSACIPMSTITAELSTLNSFHSRSQSRISYGKS